MKKKKQIRDILIPAVICGMLAAMSGAAIAAEDTVISDGVLIEGIDVSGMTAGQASDAVNQKVHEMGEATVTLTMGDTPVTATLNSLGLEWENKEILDDGKYCAAL